MARIKFTTDSAADIPAPLREAVQGALAEVLEE